MINYLRGRFYFPAVAQNLGHHFLMTQMHTVKITERYIRRGFCRLKRRCNPHALHSDIWPDLPRSQSFTHPNFDFRCRLQVRTLISGSVVAELRGLNQKLSKLRQLRVKPLRPLLHSPLERSLLLRSIALVPCLLWPQCCQAVLQRFDEQYHP